MENLKKLKKEELIEMIEDLQLENISLRAEATILRDRFKKSSKAGKSRKKTSVKE